MDRPGTRDRVRYAFDNFMAQGTSALIFGLFAISSALVVFVALVLLVTDNTNDDMSDLPSLLWGNVLRALDAGTIGGDRGSPMFLAAMLVITFGGIFILSTLIGIINAGLEGRLAELRKGRSRVVERGHLVILGWSQQIHTIVAEIIEARSDQGRSAIVILADRDPVQMEEDLRARLPSTQTTRLVFRRGSPIDIGDLALVGVPSSRAVIVLSPEVGDPDAEVIKTILAITSKPHDSGRPYHIVAEIRERANLDVARMVADEHLALIRSEEVISRITAQTCRQSGLSVVYGELFGFAGDEIYFVSERSLSGRTYGETLLEFANATVIGIIPNGRDPQLNPPGATVIGPDDRIIVVATEGSRVVRAAVRPALEEGMIRVAEPIATEPERTLLLGWNHRAPAIIRELDNYVAKGSEVTALMNRWEVAEASQEIGELVNQEINLRAGDPIDRATLEQFEVEAYDHVIVLCDSDRLDPQRADARTLITLLHLRDMVAIRGGADPSIVSEMLDVRNLALVDVARADDFIVSDQLISLMVAQIAETKELAPIFADLLDPEGVEIYLKPAGHYIALGEPVTFATVIEAARRRGETAFGWRIASQSEDAAASFGVLVNPPRSIGRTFQPDDRFIVLSDA